jgi:hypothetical protein
MEDIQVKENENAPWQLFKCIKSKAIPVTGREGP